VSECHGNYQGKPIIGSVGGIMGHFFIVFSTLKQLDLTGDSEKFWKKKEMLYFIITYVAQQMKSEIATFLFDTYIDEFLAWHELGYDDF